MLCKEGKVSVDNALNELKDNGYLKLTRRQNNKGKFYYDYDVYESLGTQIGNLDFPFTDN